tara:strand:- start:1000 stop:1665 length:666 start_codon:yes stop_codon:yes gene_type:complete
MKNLLSSTAFLVVNKELANKIGLNEVVLLADLISKEQYFIENKQIQDGFFFNTAKNIQADTTLTSHQQRKAIKKLKELGIIETKLVGIPAKQHFKIMTNKLLNYFNTSYLKSEEQDIKKTQTINKNKEIIITNNISNRKEIFINNVLLRNIEILNKEEEENFIDYWTESDKLERRMKFELQKTFDISLRLKRWAKNQEKWNKGQSKIDSQINEYIKGKELL